MSDDMLDLRAQVLRDLLDALEDDVGPLLHRHHRFQQFQPIIRLAPLWPKVEFGNDGPAFGAVAVVVVG